MITLKHAIRLCEIGDNDLVFLRRKGENIYTSHCWSGKNMRDKLDLRKIKVYKINLSFSFGECDGFEFEVIGL